MEQFRETCTLLFKSADSDGNGAFWREHGFLESSCTTGTLDPEEFLSILQSRTLGLHLTAEQLEEVRKLADKDDDGAFCGGAAVRLHTHFEYTPTLHHVALLNL